MSAAPLVLTRPAAQAAQWVQQLERLGVPLVLRPLIDIEHDTHAAARARAALTHADAVFFSSPAAVQALGPVTWPAALPAACVGPGTAAALRAHGVARVLSPPATAEAFDSEALWPVLQAVGPWTGRRWLWLRGDGGRDWLMAQLHQAGAVVESVSIYHRRLPAVPAQVLAAELAQPRLWLFSSGESIAHLRQLAPTVNWARVQALATHPRIAQSAAALGMPVALTRPDPPAVAAAWRQWAASKISA